MKNFIILTIKGFIIGIGKIIPGVSGAIIAISLGVYEKGLKIVSNIFYDLKDNLKFIIPIGIGFILSILLFSKTIVNLLDKCYLPTMLLFIGLIMGSMKEFKKNVNLKNKQNIMIFIFTLLISIFLSFFRKENISMYNFYLLIFMGFIEALSMIVPGLSGTALLMIFGYYEMIMNAFSVINIKILIPFIIGIIFGTIIISKIIEYLFNHFREKTNVVIFGLSISSILLLFIKTLNNNYNIYEIIVSLFLLILGYNITKIIEK